MACGSNTSSHVGVTADRDTRRGATEYSTAAATVAAAAKHVHFYCDYAELPAKYQEALKRVR
jgi:hypothetical protein